MGVLKQLAGFIAAGVLVSQTAMGQTPDGNDLSEPPIEAPAVSEPLPPLLEVDTNLTPLICPFRGAIEYEPGEIECGLITVPENRERSDSRLIQLHYVRIAAWGEAEDEHRDDPIIYLTGGPGVGATTYVERLKAHEVAEFRDLYILEQRGIGTSTDFCETYSSVAPDETTATSMREMEIAGADRMRLCFEEAAAQGIDLRGYNTVENARDVRALREALGFSDWNVWGISYGSHLGQMLLREDPNGVRAIILDAIVPNDLNGMFDYGRIFDRIVSNFSETCDQEGPLCEGLETRLWDAIAALRDDPVILKVEESEAFPSGELWIPPAIVAYLPFSMAYEQSEYPAVPALINAVADFAETRDPKIIAGLESILAAPGGDDGLPLSQGMSSAIRCNDGYVHAGLTAYDETPRGRWDGILGTKEGQAYMAQTCDEAGLSPRDREAYTLVETEIPTLIVNGAWDPVTPPWLAEYVHEHMPGSRLIITPYAGHGPTRSMGECSGAVMNAFFDDLDVDALDASCLEEGEERPEFITLTPTRAPFLAAGLMADAPESFIGPALWLILPIIALVLGFIMIPLGLFGRIIDGTPVRVLNAHTGGARPFGWLAAVAGLVGLGMIGVGAFTVSEISEAAVLAGFAAPADIGMWLVLACGVLGLISLLCLFRTSFGDETVRIGTLLGLAILGFAAIALTAFAFAWDLSPF